MGLLLRGNKWDLQEIHLNRFNMYFFGIHFWQMCENYYDVAILYLYITLFFCILLSLS